MQRFNFNFSVRSIFWYSIFLAILAQSCTVESFKESADGFSYRMYQDQTESQMNTGDFVLYHADYADAVNDRVFFTTRTKDFPNLRAISPEAERSMLERALTIMSPGDSMTVLIGAESLNRRNFPATLPVPEIVHIHLKVYKVYNSKDRLETYLNWRNTPEKFKQLNTGVQKKIIKSDTSAHKIRPGDEVTYRVDAIHLLPDAEITFQFQNQHTSVIPEVSPADATPVLAGLLSMHEGDSAQLLIHADSLNYKLPGTWPDDRILYRLSVLKVKSLEKRLMDMQMQEQRVLQVRAAANYLLQQAVCDWVEGSWAGDTTLAGMHIQKIEHAEAGKKPFNPNSASIHYMGFAEECLLFAESFEKIEPLQFELHQGFVIRGWDILMESMMPGDHWLVRIPPNLAFGASGYLDKVAPNAVVWYYIWRIE